MVAAVMEAVVVGSAAELASCVRDVVGRRTGRRTRRLLSL